MFFPIMVRELPAILAEVLLHERVDDDLLSYGVSNNLPGELACPACLGGDVSGLTCPFVFVVIEVHLRVVRST